MKTLTQPIANADSSTTEPLRAPALKITHEDHLDQLHQVPSVVGLKYILVPIDFSDLSIEALRYAIPIARKFKARITLLHIIDVPPYIPVYGIGEPPSTDPRIFEDRTKRLEEIAKKEVNPGLLDNTVIRTGDPSGGIIHYANEGDFDIIILTTHGTAGLRHLFMGSTAEKVVRHAQCPVLVVHSRKVRESESTTPNADLYGHVL